MILLLIFECFCNQTQENFLADKKQRVHVLCFKWWQTFWTWAFRRMYNQNGADFQWHCCWGMTSFPIHDFQLKRRGKKKAVWPEREQVLLENWIWGGFSLKPWKIKLTFLHIINRGKYLSWVVIQGTYTKSPSASNLPSEKCTHAVFIDSTGALKTKYQLVTAVLIFTYTGYGLLRMQMDVPTCFLYVNSGLHHLTNMFQNVTQFHAAMKNKALRTIISCFVRYKQKNPELSRQGKGVCQINL